jgi:hypothetical protein
MLAFGTFGVSYFIRPFKPRDISAVMFMLAKLTAGVSSTLAEENPAQINLPGQIAEHIAKCWKPPRTDPPSLIAVTIRISFSRAGAVIAEPFVTYVRAPDVPGLEEEAKRTLLAAVRACTPLPFTPFLGAAIAGRMFSIQFRSLPSSQ